MGNGIQLNKRQFDELDFLRNTTASADIFRNCSIILLSNGGHTIPGIAQMLGCSPETVKRVRGLFRKGGIAALTPKKSPGRPSQATPSFLDMLAKAVQTNPQDLGYGFATWSSARLAAHLAKETGIRFSNDQIRRLLHQEGFSVHRPKHTMKGKRDEAAYQKAKARMALSTARSISKDLSHLYLGRLALAGRSGPAAHTTNASDRGSFPTRVPPCGRNALS
jgi:transposase